MCCATLQVLLHTPKPRTVTPNPKKSEANTPLPPQDHPDVHILLGSRSPRLGDKAVKDILSAVPDAKIEALQIDVSDDASVKAAAAAIAAKYDDDAPLYGLVNNAGVGFSKSIPDTLAVNTYGPKRVCDAFIPLLDPTAGRVCNIASASGPMFVRGLDAEQKQLFCSPQTTWEQLEAVLKQYSAVTDYEGIACMRAPPRTQ